MGLQHFVNVALAEPQRRKLVKVGTPQKMNGWKPTSWRFGSNDFPDFNWVIFRFHHNFVRFHIPSWIGLVGDLFYRFYHGKSPLFTTIYIYLYIGKYGVLLRVIQGMKYYPLYMGMSS